MPAGKTHYNRKLQKRHNKAWRRGGKYVPGGHQKTNFDMSIESYRLLNVVRDEDGECSKCHKYPNPFRDIRTSVGKKKIFTCTSCGEKMRSYYG